MAVSFLFLLNFLPYVLKTGGGVVSKKKLQDSEAPTIWVGASFL